jgi:Holliday junction resolvase RusA-like endonuclease
VSGEICFDVLGTPAPKGSNRAMVRGGRAVFVPGGSAVNQNALRSWADSVRWSVRSCVSGQASPVFTQVPVSVAITFRLKRPGGHWAKSGALKASAPLTPTVKPDVDKLARSTLDALSGVVFDDDSRIVELIVRKEYAIPGQEGASVRVWERKL